MNHEHSKISDIPALILTSKAMVKKLVFPSNSNTCHSEAHKYSCIQKYYKTVRSYTRNNITDTQKLHSVIFIDIIFMKNYQNFTEIYFKNTQNSWEISLAIELLIINDIPASILVFSRLTVHSHINFTPLFIFNYNIFLTNPVWCVLKTKLLDQSTNYYFKLSWMI